MRLASPASLPSPSAAVNARTRRSGSGDEVTTESRAAESWEENAARVGMILKDRKRARWEWASRVRYAPAYSRSRGVRSSRPPSECPAQRPGRCDQGQRHCSAMKIRSKTIVPMPGLRVARLQSLAARRCGSAVAVRIGYAVCRWSRRTVRIRTPPTSYKENPYRECNLCPTSHPRPAVHHRRHS